MKPITKSEPYVLLNPSGIWYFLPESLAARFEELLELGDEAPSDEMYSMTKYQIDDPQTLRITQWVPY